MSFSQLQSKSLFKALGDILTADSQLTTIGLTGMFLDETISTGRVTPYGTMQMIMGPTEDNIPSKTGRFTITFWGKARSGAAEITLIDLGDRTEFLLDGDAGVALLAAQSMVNFKVRHIEHQQSLDLPTNAQNLKGYRLTFQIIVSKV